MCWVMPPASPAATSVSRIASSSDVLPWSTWPMIVTTGGRSTSVLVGVVEDRLGDRLVLGVDDLDVLAELGREHLDRLVGQRLGQRLHLAERHQLLHDLGHRDVEVLGDVLDRRAGVDPDRVGLGDARSATDATRPPRRRRRAGAGRGAGGAAAGWTGGGPPPGARREAWESITTRRRPPALPGARSPWSESRVGRLWLRVALGCGAVAPSPAGGAWRSPRRRRRRRRLGRAAGSPGAATADRPRARPAVRASWPERRLPLGRGRAGGARRTRFPAPSARSARGSRAPACAGSVRLRLSAPCRRRCRARAARRLVDATTTRP